MTADAPAPEPSRMTNAALQAAPHSAPHTPHDAPHDSRLHGAPPVRLPAAIRLTRGVAVVSLLALMVLGLAWELWLAPTGRGTLALKVLPLALPLAGLLKNRMYTYRWVSLLVWLYFTEGAVRAWSDTGLSAKLALAEVLLCVLLFMACALHVRWRLRHPTAAAASPAA